MASGVASEWRDWILFSNATDFGVKDPQFHRDIGFYVFRLPFLEFIAGWTFAALLVILIVTLVFHYLNGGIRLQTPFQRVTPQVKVHISVILALMALTKTVQYYLARFGLTLSHRGVVDGATYTDVKAQLPALNLLMLISVAAAILFIANIFRRGWVFPIIAVGLWGFISIVVGTIYPAVIQRFVVQPNEYAREQTYIKRNIDATRAAFGLDKITSKPFDYDDRPHRARRRSPTRRRSTTRGSGIPTPLRPGAAVDRGVPALLPVLRRRRRPLRRRTARRRRRSPACASSTPSQLPSNTWTNRHLVYTHGYGVDTAQANAHNGDQPELPALRHPAARATLDARRSPTSTSARASAATRSSTARSPSRRRTARPAPTTTQYKGDGGVQVSSFGRRLAFALRFGDFNLVYSGQVTAQSRILYLRDIQERVQTAAPFLQWDADPYAVSSTARSCGCSTATRRRTATRTRSRSTRRCRPAAGSTATSTTCATR